MASSITPINHWTHGKGGSSCYGINIAVGIMLIIGIAIFLAYHTLYVKTILLPVTVPDAPRLTLILLTDLHGRTRFLNGRLHRLVNKWNPDIVCVTGDLAQNNGQLTSVLSELGKIKPADGIFFVPGNYEGEEVRGLQKRAYTNQEYTANRGAWRERMTVLENGSGRIKKGRGYVRIYGFDNSVYGNERYLDDPDGQDVFTVLLAHSPNIISYIREQGITGDLLLTGHTHGGQIRLFGKTVGTYKHFHVGQKKNERVGLFAISRGLGTAKLPIRLNCFPEITVYQINSQDDR